MISTGSVQGDASIRLFCALRLPDDVLDGLVAWSRRALPERDGVRRVVQANLHVTLAFLGRRPAAEVPAIARELRQASAADIHERSAVILIVESTLTQRRRRRYVREDVDVLSRWRLS